MTTPAQVLGYAEDLLQRADPATSGLWPRATALLGRQGLEAAMDALWDRTEPGLGECSAKAQLLCLAGFVGPDVAARASHAWVELSRGCHHHAYELAPTATELRGWLDAVEGLVDALGSSVPNVIPVDGG